MHVAASAPMIGRRKGWGDHDRTHHRKAKLAELRSLANEIIDEYAIEPDGPILGLSAIATIEIDGLIYADDDPRLFIEPDPDDFFSGDEYDPFDDDRSYGDLLDEIDPSEFGLVDITTLDDSDLPGWGTHLAYEDTASGFTITNRPYLWSSGKGD